MARTSTDKDAVDVETARLYSETGRKYEALELVTKVVQRSPKTPTPSPN